MKTNFTLVELLVVIAIISILAALLLPTLQQAQQSALLTVCVSNYRQIYSGMIMYSDDHQVFPAADPMQKGGQQNDTHRQWWHWAVGPYVGNDTNRNKGNWDFALQIRNAGPLGCSAFPALSTKNYVMQSMSTFAILYRHAGFKPALASNSSPTFYSDLQAAGANYERASLHLRPDAVCSKRISSAVPFMPNPANIVVVTEIGFDNSSDVIPPYIYNSAQVYTEHDYGNSISNRTINWRHGDQKPVLYFAGNVGLIPFMPHGSGADTAAGAISWSLFNRHDA